MRDFYGPAQTYRPSSVPGAGAGWPSHAVYVLETPGKNHGPTEYRVAKLNGPEIRDLRPRGELDPTAVRKVFTERPFFDSHEALMHAQGLAGGRRDWPDGGIKIIQALTPFACVALALV